MKTRLEKKANAIGNELAQVSRLEAMGNIPISKRRDSRAADESRRLVKLFEGYRKIDKMQTELLKIINKTYNGKR